MSIQKFAKFAKHLDVSVVYDESLSLAFIDAAKVIFRNVRLHAFDDSSFKGEQSHLLIVCCSVSSLRLPSFRSVLSSIQRLETVMLTPDVSDVNIYKAALSLRALHVSELPASEEGFVDEMVKILPFLIKKHNESVSEGHQRQIIDNPYQMFAVFKSGKSVYANDTLKNHFGIQQLNEFETYFQQGELANILHSPGHSQQIVPSFAAPGNGISEYFISTYPLKEHETLLSVIPLKTSLQSCDRKLQNRMNFIETLKDAFLIHSSENESIPVVMIHIENSKKIIESSGEHIYNEICKELLTLAKNYFSKETDIAQWHRDVYTAYSPGASITELKEALEQFHQDVTTHIAFEGAALVLDSYVIDMHSVDLNKAISIIDHIHQKQLLSAEISNLVHYEISVKDHEMDEKDQVLYYLEKLMLNKSPIKLLNFYKGIRINTPARLVKMADGMIYVTIEKIQGYSMKLENTTVIQSNSIPFDLQANVKIVDIGKKIAVLTNFQQLKASANNRQHIRIQSDHRMHVTMTSFKSVISGTIMDISIKSIACKISNSKMVPNLESTIMLQFQLPIEHADGGMMNMAVEGKVQYVQTTDDFTKVVVILDLQEPYESHLIEYIYKRQQALINEIKMIANKL